MVTFKIFSDILTKCSYKWTMYLRCSHLEMGLRISKTHFIYMIETHSKYTLNVSVGYSAGKLTQTLKCSWNVPRVSGYPHPQWEQDIIKVSDKPQANQKHTDNFLIKQGGINVILSPQHQDVHQISSLGPLLIPTPTLVMKSLRFWNPLRFLPVA